MLAEMTADVTDENKLLLGAGFVFGVAFSMGLLAVAAATVVGAGTLFGSSVGATIAGSVLFGAIVGASLYLLAFPENRLDLPVEQFVERYAGRFVDTERRRDDRRTERL